MTQAANAPFARLMGDGGLEFSELTSGGGFAGCLDVDPVAPQEHNNQ